MSIDADESSIVAVGGSGVGMVDGVVEAFKGLGRLAHILIGTAQQVVGQHGIVSIATIVIVDEDALQGVGSEDGVGFVPGLG